MLLSDLTGCSCLAAARNSHWRFGNLIALSNFLSGLRIDEVDRLTYDLSLTGCILPSFSTLSTVTASEYFVYIHVRKGKFESCFSRHLQLAYRGNRHCTTSLQRSMENVTRISQPLHALHCPLVSAGLCNNQCHEILSTARWLLANV